MPAEIIDETEPLLSAEDAGTRTAQTPSQQSAAEGSASLVSTAEAVMDVLLHAVDRSDSEVVVVLAGDERIRELNRLWRDKDEATDVLSFSQLEGEPMGSGAEMLGDIVVSVETLRRQARQGGWSDQEELARLLLHGLLHLLGFDHQQADDELVMKAQEGILARTLLGRGLGCAWEDTRP